MKKSLSTNTKDRYFSQNYPLRFIINSLAFGNSSQQQFPSNLQGYEGEGCSIITNGDIIRE